jgi:hypothetical protein
VSFVTQVLDLGGGEFDLRIAIEGCPLEFCSTHEMAELLGGGATEDGHDVEGVRRVGGLRREGLSFQESVYLPGADYRASLGGVSIEDTDVSVAWNMPAASSVFSRVPEDVAYLTATVDASATTWTVRSTEGLTEGEVYHVDTEAVRVDSIDSDTEITVTRGVWRTTAQSHYVATSTLTGDSTLLCAMFDSPPTYRRRRVWVYGHAISPSTDAHDSGSLIARGVIATAPTLTDGATWSISIAPLTSLLDTDIGPKEGAGVITGIYYPGHTPFRFTVSRRADNTTRSEVDASATILLAGRWASQDSFCRALSDALNGNATIASWGVTFDARPTGSTWELYVRIASSDPRYIVCMGGSVIDGWFSGQLHSPLNPPGTLYADSVSASEEMRVTWTEYPFTDAGWKPPVAGLRGVPRGMHALVVGTPPGFFADITAYPWHRVYVGRSAGVTIGDTIRVTQEAVGGDGMAYAWEATVSGVDAGTGAVTWDPDTMRALSGEALTLSLTGASIAGLTIVTPASLPTVTLVRDLGIGHVGQMLRTLVGLAPSLANAGTVPFLLSADLDSEATINAAVEEAAGGRTWLLYRRYAWATNVSFADVVKHELRLLGAYLATTVTGAITIRPLVPRLTADHTIETDDLITSDGFGDLVVEPDGMLSGLEISQGYDSFTDEHAGEPVRVVALAALAAQRQYLALSIAPKSRPAGAEPSPEELIAHCYGKVSLWSRIRFSVRVPVSLRFYDALIGDCVFATIPQLPYNRERQIDGAGGGIVSLRSTVIGRSWRFAEPNVELTLLFDGLTLAGYAPTGRVTATSGSGTTWTVTLDADEYGPGGSVADASFFATGYKVRLYEYDDDVPTVRTGAVTSVSGNDVGLELDSSWTPGSSTWNLCFSPSDTSGIATGQLQSYAFLSRDDLRVHLSSGTRRPYRLSP